ncbi:MAG: hypothetical protein JSU86_19760 [Phycisphaerales bacterium]|nr:MAG: hypothetical protein JSU86_19760 [Phycisphaerales bacterium]
MKRMCVLMCVVLAAGTVLAQEEEDVTYETTTTVSGGEDLMSQLWLLEDATPLNTGQVDLRLGLRWMTASAPANLGDSSDDFVLTPSIVWGAHDNLELSLGVDAWLGDGGDKGPFEDGNYNTTVGLLWRFFEQTSTECGDGCLQLPSMALSATAWTPTGCGSSGLDGELRLIMTYEYGNGVRSHFNVFAKSVGSTDYEGVETLSQEARRSFLAGDDRFALDPRHFQYGAVIGGDGPLCADGAVRWVADYQYRSSYYYGRTGVHIAELGWEWDISDACRLGMSFLAGLDHSGDTPNFGASLVYSYSLVY